MDSTRIGHTVTRQPKRARELPYQVPIPLSEAIDELVDAIDRDDLLIDMYYEDMLGLSRMVNDDLRNWLVWYYINDGWKKATDNDFDID